MTAQIRLQPGTVVKVEGVLHKVLGRNEIGLNLRSLGEMPVTVTRPHDEVARLYFQRPRRFEIVEQHASNLPEAIVENLQRQIDTFNTRAQDEAIRRLDYVRACDDHFAAGTHKRVMGDYATIATLTAKDRRQREADERGLQPENIGLEKVSGAAVRQWYRRWRKAGRNIVALVPLHDRKGRIGFRIDPEVEAIIAQRVREDWLLAEGPPLSHVILMIQDDVRKVNEGRVIQLVVPDGMSIRRWVSASVSEFEKTFHREGKAAAEQRFRHVKAAPQPTHPLEIVEVDHTPLDVLIVDDEGDEVRTKRGKRTVVRPWLTVAVCATTRMIVGFYLTLERPSWTSVMNCLRMGILPKNLEDFQVKTEWPVFGVPQILKLDNGKEFHSRSMNAAAGQLRMELRYMPRQKPHLKGKVERLLGTVSRDFCAYLPGRTFRDARERGEYDSTGKAAFTMKKLTELLVIWIVDIYHNRPHAGLLGRSPLERWQELSGMGVRLPPNADDLSPLISLVVERTIRSTGITFLGLNYQSESLRGARRRKGFHYGREFLVKIDPYSIGEVLVLLDEKSGWEPVPCEDPMISDGVSLAEWKETVALARKMTGHGKRVSHQTLVEAMKLLRAEALHKGAKPRKLTSIDADWFRENLDAPWFDVAPDPDEQPVRKARQSKGRKRPSRNDAAMAIAVFKGDSTSDQYGEPVNVEPPTASPPSPPATLPSVTPAPAAKGNGAARKGVSDDPDDWTAE